MKFARPNKKKTALVLAFAALFLIADVIIGIWFSGKSKETIANHFNEKQLIIAHNIADLIERDIEHLKKEILLLNKNLMESPYGLEAFHKKVKNSFTTLIERGVKEIEIIDLKHKTAFHYTSQGNWFLEKNPTLKSYGLSLYNNTLIDGETVVSFPQIQPFGISMVLCTPMKLDSTKLLLFHINISWFLDPYFENIRSGKTGYAWIIDGDGTFLFHPVVDFTGRNAFEARPEKTSDFSFEKINLIQKEAMLKGIEGTSWYYSGWHRGLTGKIKKLIAYCPVHISEDPPQTWSVAVVAPFSEIEEAVHRNYLIQFLSHGLLIAAFLIGTLYVLFREIKWSDKMEKKVKERTLDLKKSEEKYRSLVESAEDFIYTLDLNGNFLSMNSFTANFFGGSQSDFIGFHLSKIFSKAQSDEQQNMVELVFANGKSSRNEFELEAGTRQIWISANFMPVKNEEGRVTAVLCIARDITKDKNLERQLLNAEKLASLGTLAAGVAHEINNPLGIILGFCDLLARKKPNESQEYKDLKTIERQGLHCKTIVENLLSFARVGKENSEFTDINLCLTEIIKVVKHTLEINNIELDFKIHKNLPLVKGDFRQLQQVFLNLINNAVAAMKIGGILSLHTCPGPDRNKIHVKVVDNGIGINKQDMEHIFEPFFTTKPEGEGTGLGLFVSYGIIAKFGGALNCESRAAQKPEERGNTIFTVELLTKTSDV